MAVGGPEFGPRCRLLYLYSYAAQEGQKSVHHYLNIAEQETEVLHLRDQPTSVTLNTWFEWCALKSAVPVKLCDDRYKKRPIATLYLSKAILSSV